MGGVATFGVVACVQGVVVTPGELSRLVLPALVTVRHAPERLKAEG